MVGGLGVGLEFSSKIPRGVARIFKGGGGVILCQKEGTHQIVISFLPPVGCLLKKGLQKGGHRHPRYTPDTLFFINGNHKTLKAGTHEGAC